MVGLRAPPADAAQARAHFGGAPAPVVRLKIEGDRAGLA
jgi:levansucrase